MLFVLYDFVQFIMDKFVKRYRLLFIVLLIFGHYKVDLFCVFCNVFSINLTRHRQFDEKKHFSLIVFMFPIFYMLLYSIIMF